MYFFLVNLEMKNEPCEKISLPFEVNVKFLLMESQNHLHYSNEKCSWVWS